MAQKKIFIDTWGWLSIVNQREKRHEEIKEFYSKLIKEKGQIFTTDYILDETITLVFRRLDKDKAIKILEIFESAENEGYLIVERIGKKRFKSAEDLRIKYIDKPDISFTDLTTMIVMEELGVTDIITGDEHFLKVGMGFKLQP